MQGSGEPKSIYNSGSTMMVFFIVLSEKKAVVQVMIPEYPKSKNSINYDWLMKKVLMNASDS